MNQFPTFNPNNPALSQLSANRMNLISKGQKANQIQPGQGYRLTQTSGGTTLSVIKRRKANPPPPFELSVSTAEGLFYWKVSQYRSSIQDGTNGNAIDLSPTSTAWTSSSPIKFDIDTVISSTKYIVLKASVDEFLVITDWTLAAVDAADAVEVGDDGGTPPKQDEIRLLIGKVLIDDTTEPDTISATQAVFSPQIIVDDMTNGMLCRVFANHGIQIDNL